MRRSLAALCAVAASLLVPPPATAADGLTIAKIMSRDFAGTPPTSPRWSYDGKRIYYERHRPDTDLTDLYEVDVATGRTSRVDDRDRGTVDPARVVYSRDHRFAAFVSQGNVFLRDVRRGTLRQITRTDERARSPQILLDGRVAYRIGDVFLAFDPATGTTSTLADLRLADDPAAKKSEDYLQRESLRLFDVLRERKARRESGEKLDDARRAADPTRAGKPWYLGKGKALRAASLAPDGRWLLVVVGPKRDLSEREEEGADGGKPGKLANYVTEDGYVEIRDTRPKVGTGHPESPGIRLLDLEKHDANEVDFSTLPGLNDDPLAELRAAAATQAADAAKQTGEPAPAEPAKATPRVVNVRDLEWSDDGGELAIQFFSYDNKDRWIAVLAPASPKLRPLERLHDPAWINAWRFNDLGWMRDGKTLWYLSEESGYSQLWLRPLVGSKRELTSGRFEIDNPQLSRDGNSFFVTANREHPGIVEAYRVDARSGELTRLTDHKGTLELVVSPDERQLLLLASHIAEPPELFVQADKPGAPERKLTDTAGAGFKAVDWVVPDIVAVPSTHGAGKIWAKVYTPPGWTAGKSYPAVMFIHGAGYLQDVDYGWSDYYQREFMFSTLLARRGYVVMNMDYRASSGYGRDWRTAIYRQMGWPELEDLADGVAWMAAEKGVDPRRVGVWGGSYGGFLTEMAMFRTPDLFACGAALRPVSDWAQYNHGYTSDILNTPEVDPEAYRKAHRSSTRRVSPDRSSSATASSTTTWSSKTRYGWCRSSSSSARPRTSPPPSIRSKSTASSSPRAGPTNTPASGTSSSATSGRSREAARRDLVSEGAREPLCPRGVAQRGRTARTPCHRTQSANSSRTLTLPAPGTSNFFVDGALTPRSKSCSA